jgi:acetyltransferase-like isoleucine patch superfamily enzyme
MTLRTTLRPAYRQVRGFLNRVRNIWLRPFFAHLDPDSIVSPQAIFYGREGISLAAGAFIFPHAVLNCTYWPDIRAHGGRIEIGEGTVIQPFAFLHTHGGLIRLGKRCSVNPYAVLYGEGGLMIGDDVRIAAHTVIIPENHGFERRDVPIALQKHTCQGIAIGDDVWIGAGVKILDGVQIARGCIIGAGSVVSHSTEEYGIYIGSPARRIKTRGDGEPPAEGPTA